ncbi:pyruvate, phosphate dikinase [Ktedonosporobacter rubrisoli]|uniref:Pyruvate, phosphate dikinase n=1 Tax=Ktedonosporobacter rubrisoli TaxID=2509675 RepID=A0A4P6JN32_KTERU|nr:PEP/pyruvate-binding domain-containing protein [Ktedonosporobacter rubrisoli]QBD76480.1 pyruvate, phosphate dikinase [Ktedonosporobacter rubrisoli]
MSNEQDSPLILALDDTTATLEQVGGKGASLARLSAAGLPVPPGFHITTQAYQRFVSENRLEEAILEAATAAQVDRPDTLEKAASQIEQLFMQNMMPGAIAEAICQAYAQLGHGDSALAVRSSATAEDLPEMSFAGQQETYLNIHGEVMLLKAVKRCWASLWTARALAYRLRQGIAQDTIRLAVVVQELVSADAAGILFTANPLTAAREQIMINASWGLGEAIVSGQVTPDTIVIDKTSEAIIEQQISEKKVMTVSTTSGTREKVIPEEKRSQAVLQAAQVTKLVQLGKQIEALYNQPMDIEWALAKDSFFIVQARPITTLRKKPAVGEEWNDSLSGDYLWTNGNLGEAVPDVMTPCTWSLMRIFMADAMSSLELKELRPFRPVGNIGGRPYMNLSLTATIGAAFGMNRQRLAAADAVFGRVPAQMEIPLVPISRWRMMAAMLPEVIRLKRSVRADLKKLPAFLATAPQRCEALRDKIQATTSAADLLKLWHMELEPHFHESGRMLQASARQDGGALVWVRHKLSKLLGESEANVLLSSSGNASGQLASLGLLLGLTQLARGEIDRSTFARQYGHRSPHEFEVMYPRPGEDPQWIDQQLAGLREAKTDITTLLARQQEARAAAWQRFAERHPGKVHTMRRQIEKATKALHDREAARSEVIRVFWVLRTFVQRAALLTRQGNSLFFLSIQEILELLQDDTTSLSTIPARRATYERYSQLPTYPVLIRGQFDPFQWAADPQRRSDIFDAHHTPAPGRETMISGFAGAAGIVEGRARIIRKVEEGDQLQAGEILVTTITNVGWTPLFPRAAAIVTDIGAPLSHAAIVARELGIPAVVGCGSATMRLHTGDQLRVNGEQGTVEVLQEVKASLPVPS